MSKPNAARFKREKDKLRLRLCSLPCYARLTSGKLTVEDCVEIDKALGTLTALTAIYDAWFQVNIQTCSVLVNEWRDGGAKWLSDLLVKTNPKVFKAYRVFQLLHK